MLFPKVYNGNNQAVRRIKLSSWEVQASYGRQASTHFSPVLLDPIGQIMTKTSLIHHAIQSRRPETDSSDPSPVPKGMLEDTVQRFQLRPSLKGLRNKGRPLPIFPSRVSIAPAESEGGTFEGL